MLTRILTAFVSLFVVCAIAANAQVATPNSKSDQTGKPQATSPEKVALIKELLDVTNSKKNSEAILNAMFDEMQKQMPSIIWQSISGMKQMKELTEAEQQHLRDEATETAMRSYQRFRDLFLKRINFAEMTNEISYSVYTKYFSENELRDLITFYQSSTGKHSLEIMPALIAESMAETQERMMPVMKDLMQEISSDESTKFQTEIVALAKSHHKVTTTRPRNRQTKP